MNSVELARSIRRRSGLSSSQIENGLQAIKDTVARTLSEGRTVSIPKFGTFATVRYPERQGVNPLNPSESITLPPATLPRFRPTIELREKIKTVMPKDGRNNAAYARAISIPYLDLSKKTVPKEILTYVPEHIARRYQIVPIEIKDNKLVVGMIDPEDQETIELIKKRIGMSLEVSICTLDDLNHILDQYSGLQAEVAEIVKSSDLTPEEITPKKKEEAPLEQETSEHAPAAKIVASLFKRAVRERASDIHIEPMEEEIIVRFRIDGVLRKIVSLPKPLHPALISRIKILSNLKIDETRLPQDGRIQMHIGQNDIDFRISTLPTVNGEKMVARILDKSAGVISIEKLGLHEDALMVLQENITKSHGMILVTGPTGSGKTTTLYAILDRLKDITVNIVTLEDPVEYRMTTINQCQVNPDIDYTFANGLRSILRQDPNIIMVGEIRDFDTANIAVHSALTGHIVLSTLHTNNAAGAIPRLIDMKIEPFLLISSLNAVIAQRLCRQTCPDCREPLNLSPEQLTPVTEELKLLPSAIQSKINLGKLIFYHGKGCGACGNSGYRGRLGIYEIFTLTDSIKTLVSQKATSTQLQEAAVKENMVTLKQDGILKALEGKTTIEEVWRVTKD